MDSANIQTILDQQRSAKLFEKDEKFINRSMASKLYHSTRDDSWELKQRNGAQKNAKENKDWLKKTTDRNRALAKDPARIQKIKEHQQLLIQDETYMATLTKRNREQNGKKIITPIGEFSTLTQAAEALGIAMNTLRRYITCQKPGYKMEQKNLHRRTTGKPIMTPSGPYESISTAAIHASNAGLANALKKISKWIKQENSGFYYITCEEYKVWKDEQ